MISLEKGQKISLEKDVQFKQGDRLKRVCVGVNWGAIETKGWFGQIKKVAVDLDASCATFDQQGQLLDVVYYGQLSAPGIQHSGDDLTGDMNGDDGLDNEVISVDLDKVRPEVHQIIFVLNSYRGQDFKDIPFASIRLYEGSPSKVEQVLAHYDIANEPQFAGSVSMVLGKLYRAEGWHFQAIGEPTQDRKLDALIQTVQKKYL